MGRSRKRTSDKGIIIKTPTAKKCFGCGKLIIFGEFPLCGDCKAKKGEVGFWAAGMPDPTELETEVIFAVSPKAAPSKRCRRCGNPITMGAFPLCADCMANKNIPAALQIPDPTEHGTGRASCMPDIESFPPYKIFDPGALNLWKAQGKSRKRGREQNRLFSVRNRRGF